MEPNFYGHRAPLTIRVRSMRLAVLSSVTVMVKLPIEKVQ